LAILIVSIQIACKFGAGSDEFEKAPVVAQSLDQRFLVSCSFCNVAVVAESLETHEVIYYKFLDFLKCRNLTFFSGRMQPLCQTEGKSCRATHKKTRAG